MLQALKRHWPEYLMEAWGLMMFMIAAGALTALFEYPGSPVRLAIEPELLRHACLGIIMGCVIMGIIYSPWGQRSGAHINPAVTWSFYRLGKISFWDAVFYTIFQFTGAILAPMLLLWAIGEPFTAYKVHYATTEPGPQGELAAFAAEFIISFILMLALLLAINSKRFEKKAGIIAAILVALYIAFESPLSGMSLNPARSFGSGFTAHRWTGIWLYFLAPMLSMLLAAEVYRLFRKDRLHACPKLHHGDGLNCIFCNYKEGPDYPVEAA